MRPKGSTKALVDWEIVLFTNDPKLSCAWLVLDEIIIGS